MCMILAILRSGTGVSQHQMQHVQGRFLCPAFVKVARHISNILHCGVHFKAKVGFESCHKMHFVVMYILVLFAGFLPVGGGGAQTIYVALHYLSLIVL